MSAAAREWTPEELWILAWAEKLRDTCDSAGIGRRRDEIDHAEVGGQITEATAVALVAEVGKRRAELFADLRNRRSRPTLAEQRRGRRTFTPRPFPNAGPDESVAS